MSKYGWRDHLFGVAIVVAVVAVVASLALIQPYMEARTYNRLTGKNVTMWDALWVDLRVQDGAK